MTSRCEDFISKNSECTSPDLPSQIGPELNVARAVPAHHRAHLPERRRSRTQIRQVELRMVQDVQEFALQHELQPLLDADLLVYGSIEAPEPRSREIKPLPEGPWCRPLREVFAVGRAV